MKIRPFRRLDRRVMRGLGRPRRSEVVVAFRPRKEDAACCVAKRDDLGRLPIGYCSPTCERRPGGGAA